MAHEIARFPQEAVRADRRSVLETYGVPVREACVANGSMGSKLTSRRGPLVQVALRADWAAMATSQKSDELPTKQPVRVP